MLRRTLLSGVGVFGASLALGLPSRATAKTHVVQMITEPGAKLYSPDLLKVAIGDQVRFENISGHHNTESIEGMIPDGAQPWISGIDETFTVTITHEGVYGYKCTPHYENGMVGLIIAGDGTVNLDQAKAVEHPVRAANLFEILLGLAS